MNERFSRLIDRVQFVGILLAIFVVPLIFYIGNQNIVLFKSIAAEMIVFTLLGLWFIESLETEKFELDPNPLNKPIVAYFLWVVLTVLFVSPFWFYSIEELGRYACVFVLFFLIQKTIHDRSRLKWALWVLFSVCILSTAYGYLQFNNVSLIDWGRSVLVSTFGNKNFFAGFLMITTPVLVGYGLATNRWVIRGILFVLAGFQFYAIMTTETRTAVLSAGFTMVLFILLSLRFVWWKQSQSKKWRQLLIFVVVAVVALTVLYLNMPEDISSEILEAFDLQQGTSRVRWIMWTGSTRAALAQPVTGHGHGVFQLVFPNYRPHFYHRFRVSHNTRHSHNEYMEVIMETGVVGLALFLLIFITLGVVTYRFLKRNDDMFYQYLVIGLFCGVYGSVIQNFASVNLRWMSTTFTFWFVMGLTVKAIKLCATGSESAEERSRRSIKKSYRLFPRVSWKFSVHALIILSVVAVGYNFYRMVRADFLLKRMNALISYAEGNRISWERASRTGEKSVYYNPYNLSAKYKLGYIYLSSNNYSKANETYDALTDLAPNYAQIHNNIALTHRKFNEPYRSLLHFEWATWLEDNFRNRMNLMRRHSDKGFVQRSTYHGLRVPQIGLEEIRDAAHTNSKKLASGSYSSGISFKTSTDDMTSRILRSMYFLADKFDSVSPEMSAYFRMVAGLYGPEEKGTLADIYRMKRRDDDIPGIVLLGIARQLRDSRDSQSMKLRQQYFQILRKSKKRIQKPYYRLAVAEFYAQLGQIEKAKQLMKGLSSQLGKSFFIRDTKEFIQSQAKRIDQKPNSKKKSS